MKALVCRFAAVVVLIGGIVATMVAVPAGAVPNPETDGINNLAACYAQSGSMVVELVIDQSRSLRSTDPDGRRVELAQAISQAFSQMAAIPVGGRAGRVDLRTVVFGGETAEVAPWVSLDQGTGDSFSASLEQLRERDGDWHTDYVDALSNARADVLARSAEVNPVYPGGVCRAVVWFTDGEFDFDPTGIRPGWAPDLTIDSESKVQEAINRGKAVLCETGGLADQYRASETYLLTAALTSPRFGPEQADLLRDVTTGELGGCGGIDGRATGTYFSADDIGRLVIDIVPSVLGQPAPTPQRAQCQSGVRCDVAFAVSRPSIAVSVFVQATAPGVLTVEGPSGSSMDLSGLSSDGTVDGARVSSRGSGQTRVVTVDLAAGGPESFGTWKVALVPEADAELTAWVSQKTGLALLPGEVSTWTRGQQNRILYSLRDADGNELPAGVVTASNLAATVTHGDLSTPATLNPVTATSFELTYEPSLSESASLATVAVQGTVTTSAGDQVPVSVKTEVPVKVAGAPEVAPRYDLGAVQAERSKERDASGRQPVQPIEVSKALEVFAAADGGGEVCYVSADVRSGEGDLQVAPQGPICVTVAPGQSAELPLEVAAESPSSGAITGALELTTTSAATGESAQVRVPVSGDLFFEPPRPIFDPRAFWLLVVGSILAAAALWAGLSWWTARFNDLSVIRAYRIPVSVGPADVVLTEAFGVDRFTFIEAEGSHRASVGALALRAPLRVFSAQDALASQRGALVHGPLGSAGRRSSLSGRLAHKVHGQWALVLDPVTALDVGSGRIQGELLLFAGVEATSMPADGGESLRSALGDLVVHFDQLRRRLGETQPRDGEAPDPQESGFETSSFKGLQ